MKNAIILKIVAVGALAFAAACQTATTTTVNHNSAHANTNGVARTDVKSPDSGAPDATKPAAAGETKADKPANDSPAAPTEVYKTAYAARKNKDIAALKRVMSKDALEFMSIFVEPGKTVDDVLLKMTETPQAATDESRNEKITGDKATLEYPDENGKWKTLDFVKENGEWKLTMPMADAPGGGGAAKNK